MQVVRCLNILQLRITLLRFEILLQRLPFAPAESSAFAVGYQL